MYYYYLEERKEESKPTLAGDTNPYITRFKVLTSITTRFFKIVTRRKRISKKRMITPLLVYHRHEVIEQQVGIVTKDRRVERIRNEFNDTNKIQERLIQCCLHPFKDFAVF